MPRDLPIGNGSLYLCFDEHYQIREITYPYAGSENHTIGHPCRFGIFVDGVLSWVNTRNWKLDLRYQDDSSLTNVKGRSDAFKLSFVSRDGIDFYENLWLRELTVTNESDAPREVRIFFCFDFHISETEVGDTAAYNPTQKTLTHYKKNFYFSFSLLHPEDGPGIDMYATGRKELPGNEGTWKDAEDGVLSKNPIAQGSVDSAFGTILNLGPGESQTVYVWMAVGNSWPQTETLIRVVTERHPASFLERTHNFWKFWVDQECFHRIMGTTPIPSLTQDTRKDSAHLLRYHIPDEFRKAYDRSLLILRTHVSKNGASVASIDSDSLFLARDTYAYLWPRDGANIALSFSQGGYHSVSRDFFKFCYEIISPGGYFLHKFNLDGSLASSWHPWILNRTFQLPIQEDETGYVLWTLKEHFQVDRDFEFITPLYKKVIKPAGIFLRDFRDLSTGLPLPSYDLWEERHGTFLHTSGIVWAGLLAAAYFSGSFGESALCRSFLKAASEIKEGVLTMMWDADRALFYRGVRIEDGKIVERDETPDISALALVETGFLDPGEPEERHLIVSMLNRFEETLRVPTPVGGYARYGGDLYYRSEKAGKEEIPGNPWFIGTFWMAQGYFSLNTKESTEKGLEHLRWGMKHCAPSGVMPEQLDPIDGTPLSVAPLAWSHSGFINALHAYARNRLRARTEDPDHPPAPTRSE